MKLSHHAAERLHERHIPVVIVDLLQHYGQVRRQPGATVLFFDEKGRRKAEAELRHALSHFDTLGNTYLVEASDSNEVVTVGYRFKRVKEK